MGFLKNMIQIILLGILLFSCSKQLVLSDLNYNSDGHLMFGKTNERTFYYPFNLGDSLKMKWTADTKGSYKNTSMTFLDEYMFIGDLAGNVYAFELISGKEMGQQKSKGAVNISPIIYTTKIAFVVEELKEVYSTIYFYDYYKGDIISEHVIKGSCSNELVKNDDAVLLLSDNGILFNYSLSGNKKWEIDTKSSVRCAPAMSNDKFIFANLNGEVIAVNINSKEIIYRNKLAQSIQSGITINGKDGYFGDDDGNVTCFDIETGALIWNFETGDQIKSIPVMNDKNLLVGNLKGNIYSLDKNSGELNWDISTGGIINTTPILFDDYLVQPDLFKLIHFVDVETGEIVKQISVEKRLKMSPVYFNNTIYFGMDKGEILAFEIVGVGE
jgi:outer membrane protein assembly factor BamB